MGPAKPKMPKTEVPKTPKAAPKIKAEPKTKAQPKVKAEPKPKAEAKFKAEPKPRAAPKTKQTGRKTTGGHAPQASNIYTYDDGPPAYQSDEGYGGYDSEERYAYLRERYNSDDARDLMAMIDADPWGRNSDDGRQPLAEYEEYYSDDGGDMFEPAIPPRESNSDNDEDEDEYGMVDQGRREGIDGYWGHDRWGKWGWVEYDDF